MSDLKFTLDSANNLSFSLGNDENMAFGISTPHVIDADVYDDAYEITPKTYTQKLETKSKLMKDDITVLEIPYFETSNEDGTTVYIANTIA